jgi:TonB family protein
MGMNQRLCATVLLLAATSTSLWGGNASPKELERLLKPVYEGKTLVLREFHSGSDLQFDSKGKLLKGGLVGPWTLDGEIKVKQVKVSNDELEIRGNRLYLEYDESKRRFEAFAGDKVVVHIQTGSPPDGLSPILNLINGAFLSSEDSLADFVPDFWKSFVLGLASGSPAATDESKAVGQPAVTNRGIQAPVPLLQPEPPYTPEARGAHVTGTSILRVVIDEQGRVGDVFLQKPIGMGLDESAVETVRRWRFKPALKDGKPVKVSVMVQVSFRLFEH